MRGIILAAGKGSRLNGNSPESPKCLTQLGGETLVERQIRLLRGAGIEDIAMVIGCQSDRGRVEDVLEDRPVQQRLAPEEADR